jgi:hypothetical protein
MTSEKICVALLTRGYSNIENYGSLIKRNLHIFNNLNDKSIDILVFHEGNILENHQNYIKSKTPFLKLIFINILNFAFKKEKNNILFDKDTEYFDLNYRHMCSFWFIDFFNFVNDYDKIIRIDEDCYIDSNVDTIFKHLDSYLFVCGTICEDLEYVTKGLNDFSLDFIKKKETNYNFKKFDSKCPSGPYTNLFAINLKKIKNYKMFFEFVKHVENSNLIYIRRWGDLPLWGEVINYIFGENELHVDKSIKYFHQSHNTYVNK